MKRLLLALLLLGSAIRAEAANWTDIWFNFFQQGYGYNIVQSDGFLYVTFYVYDEFGFPTWYAAGLNWDGVDSYTGTVYEATGTFFGAPWIPGNFVATAVGTATFKPSAVNNWQANFSYAITGVGSVAESIQRQTLTSIATGGYYVGGQNGAYTGCSNPNDSYTYTDTFDLTLTHLAGGNATFEFTYPSLSCTLAGTYEQHGQYYLISNAAYTCSDGLETTASMSEIKATSLGIEGRFYAADVGGGCAESATFAGVFVE